jgi:5-methyltetrahydrofolate--homocysteine methyltransferase
VPVASRLLGPGPARQKFLDGVRADYDAIRTRHAAKGSERPIVPLEEARDARTPVDWTAYRPVRPHLLARQAADVWTGPPDDHWHRAATQFTRVFDDYPLEELRRYIDWTPFFSTWEITGRYPDVLANPATGEAARRLFEDAQAMLDRVVAEQWLTARGVVGLFPASGVGDDIEVYADESRQRVLTRLHGLRQQGRHREGVPNRCLSDYVAPKETGLRDHVGAFAVTTGHGVAERVVAFRDAYDDYSAILLESLADRLAEAFAERLHERVRTELWGYSPDERLDEQGLLAERYVGIRPAPGYPACPDHTEKATLFDLLRAPERVGVTLTESMAMSPGASVSGWYFAAPHSQYFVVGRVGRDQVEDYAARKGWTRAEAERWLGPNLAYEPES